MLVSLMFLYQHHLPLMKDGSSKAFETNQKTLQKPKKTHVLSCAHSVCVHLSFKYLFLNPSSIHHRSALFQEHLLLDT